MKKFLLASFFLMSITAALAQGPYYTTYRIIDFYTGKPIVGLDAYFQITSDPILYGYEGPLPTQSGGLVSFHATTTTSTGKLFFSTPCITIVSGSINTRTNGQIHDIVVKGGKAELMARDALTDVGAQPNPSDDVWKSPDIWNTRDLSGDPNVHQDPGYLSVTNGNLMKMRVTNIGCFPSQPSYVKLYWTLASTGERWPRSWTGQDKINNMDAGAEIKTGTAYVTNRGYPVGTLQPGQSVIIEARWFPPNPDDYAVNGQPSPVPNNAEICFLGRIDDPVQDPMYDEVSNANASTGHNIKFNNNIVTRNTNLINLAGAYKQVRKERSIFVNNYLEENTRFNVKFRALTVEDMGFADLGTATLKLGDKLWQAWTDGGRLADGLEVSNEELREVKVTDIGNAVLRNIDMEPGVFMNIGASFELNDETDNKGTYMFGFSQEKVDRTDDEENYGSECILIVTVNGEENTDEADGFAKQAAVEKAERENKSTTGTGALSVYPNPAGDNVVIRFTSTDNEGVANVRITDLNGKLVRELTAPANNPKGNSTVTINTSDIKNGLYIITVQTKQSKQSAKVNIRH